MFLITRLFVSFFINEILTTSTVFFVSKHACLDFTCFCMEVQRQLIRQVENTFLYELRKFLKYLETEM